MIERVWLDWTEPGLAAAARWLSAAGTVPPSGSGPPLCDLGDTVCVVPGRRAGRTLLAALVEACTDPLVPPTIITPGLLAETLSAPRGPLATGAERAFAWMSALDAAPPAALGALLGRPPAADDLAGRHRLARMLSDLHRELSGQRLTPDDVAGHAEAMLRDDEAARWRSLDALVPAYIDALDRAELLDPGRADDEALRQGDLNAPGRLVLIGVTELNAVQRAFVDAVADRTTGLVIAPAGLADRFDEHGCVVPERWAEEPVDVEDEHLVVADHPESVAAATLRCLAALDGRYGPGDVSIGLADESLAPIVHRIGRGAGLDVHIASGRPLARTRVVRLLAAVADHLEDPRSASVAALLRRVDLEARVDRRRDEPAIAAYDKWRADALPAGTSGGGPTVQRVHRDLDALLAPLRQRGSPAASCAALMNVLGEVYDDDDPPEPIADACARVAEEASALARIVPALQPAADGAGGLRLLLAELEDATIPQEPRADQVEALGWLELPVDPSPALIVAGVSESPGAFADAFLPDALRARCGLTCAAHRYARDAWAMQTIVHGREHLRLVVGRRQADGEPLAPSRLLVACPDEQLAGRILRLTDETANADEVDWPGIAVPAETTRFTVPEVPEDAGGIERMSVTAFRTYLQCPYRFRLGRIIRLRAVEDDAMELDPLQFGNLAHRVLQAFGETESVRDETDAERIEAFLIAELHRAVEREYGPAPPAAVRLQVERLAVRLRVFARNQAAHRRAGWRIVAAERMLPETARLDIPGQDPIRVTGIVDRIDLSEAGDQSLIIDYKTSEAGKPPGEIHRKKDGTWVDLQLPLYHHLVPRDLVSGEVRTAYFALPRDAAKSGLHVAEWSDDDIDEAVNVARDVVRDIRDGRFEINEAYPPYYRDEFATICQTTVFGGSEAPGDA